MLSMHSSSPERDGIAVVTIVARNYLAQARTLMDSLVMAEPLISRFVFVVDAIADVTTLAHAQVLTSADVFEYEHYAGLASTYDVTEMATCVKPFLLRYLLRLGYDKVVYLDPDIEVFQPLDPIIAPLDDADIVLTPHITGPIPLDGYMPDEIVLLRAGAYNLGMIGIARSPASSMMLDWWSERLERFCVNDVAAGLFTDQKWIDLVPGLVDRVAIVRHAGCNVAYWNLHTRPVHPEEPERLTSGDAIVFFHYSGFDVRRPDELSRHQNRIRVSDEPGLRTLLNRYASRVLANGFERCSELEYGYGRFSNGVELDSFARVILRRARAEGHRFPDPMDVAAQPSAWDFLNQLADEGTGPPITRYLHEIWAQRFDVRSPFCDLAGLDRHAFEHWLRSDASGRIPRAYLAAAGVLPTASREHLQGVNVAGFFRLTSGIGEAARSYVAALGAAGCPTHLADLSSIAEFEEADTSLTAAHRETGLKNVNLICVNADTVRWAIENNPVDVVPRGCTRSVLGGGNFLIFPTHGFMSSNASTKSGPGRGS